jgi:hypothetical protein
MLTSSNSSSNDDNTLFPVPFQTRLCVPWQMIGDLVAACCSHLGHHLLMWQSCVVTLGHLHPLACSAIILLTSIQVSFHCIPAYFLKHQSVLHTNTHMNICMSISGVVAQGNPRNVTIFWSVVCPHLLYSTSSPVPLTKYMVIPQWFIDSVLNSRQGSNPKKEKEPLGSVFIPYVKGISEK